MVGMVKETERRRVQAARIEGLIRKGCSGIRLLVAAPAAAAAAVEA